MQGQGRGLYPPAIMLPESMAFVLRCLFQKLGEGVQDIRSDQLDIFVEPVHCIRWLLAES